MAETTLDVIDGLRTHQSLAVQALSGKLYGGHYTKAVPEGGCSVYRNLDLGVTGQVVKGTPGQLYGGVVHNQAGATPSGTLTRYLKIYNKASAPTGSDTPVLTIVLEDGVPTELPAIVCGIVFSAGISVRATTGIADGDTGAPGTNEVVVNLLYA